MTFLKTFICASETKNEYEKHVSAPQFRKIFHLRTTKKSILTICGLGFYRAFINGKEITKGMLAPYISNTDDVVYYDTYEVDKFCKVGENELLVVLGNGLQNGIGGEIFGFDKANWRSSPKLSVSFYSNDKFVFETDETFLWSESPITFDDLWAGEHYDARKENINDWKSALITNAPKGEKRDSSKFFIKVNKKVSPVCVFPYEDGYIYDFGLNTAGICELNVQARAGQKISLYYFEIFHNGKICTENISFGKRTREFYWQRDEYITKDGKNIYVPSFTYHGFRYVYVQGLTKKQAKKSALKMMVMTASVKQTFKFSCSDKRLEKLLKMVENSNESNFLYYPTDCPHREKNGWTGDAMLSAEQLLLSAGYDAHLREWLCCIRKSQRENGQLPRIVPTTDWGFTSGESGPNWDGALIEITYQLFQKNGDKTIIEENLPAIDKYFKYLSTRINENGLLSFGLGDREQTFTNESSAHTTPNEVTDTLATLELLNKTIEMARVVNAESLILFASNFTEQLKTAFIKHRIDENAKVIPFTQTGQCMLISACVFDGERREQAFKNLVELLNQDRVVKMGVLGYRRLFEVLAENGQTKLACDLLLTENYSGYYYYVKKGMSSMPESFLDYKDGSFERKDGGKMLGLNHHWYGHILASVLKYILGLNRVNSTEKTIEINPFFLDGIDNISAETEFANDKINLSWRKGKKHVEVAVKTSYSVKIPQTIKEYNLVSKKENKDVKYYLYRKNK